MADTGAAPTLEALEKQLADLSQNAQTLQQAVTVAWMFLNACLIFLMQLGFAMLEVGSVRVFHMQNILIKNVVDGAITVAAWFFFGYALYGDGSAFGGYKNFLLLGMDSEPLSMADFILAVSFAASSVTIVSGAMAERCKLPAYFFFSACMGGIVYPLAAHWVWNGNGWLACTNPDKTFSNVLGYMDYAGGTVVHSLGGAAALVAVYVLGPRHGRFGIDGEVVELEGVVGNSGVYKVLGTLVLFVSWLSFNASAAYSWDRIHVGALAGSNTVIAASFSCFTVMAWKTLYNRFEMNLAHSTDGLLAGCVGITAGAVFMEPWAAAIVGVVAGIIYTHTADAMLRFQLDDVVNAVAIHLTPGIWGAIAIGLFGKGSRMAEAYASGSFELGVEYDEGVVYGGSGKLLGTQIFGSLIIVCWSAIVNLPLFFLLRHFKSGYKPRDTYQWSKYPKNPQIITLDGSNGGAPRPTQGEGTQVSQLNSQVLGYTQANPTSNGIHPPPSHSTASHIAPLSHNTIPPTSQPMSQTGY